MTALRAIYADLDDIPVQLRAHYEWDAKNRWRLQVDAVDGVELGEVSAAKADADRCFEKLAEKIKADLINDALRAAGGDRELLAPHLACKIEVDRETFVTRVTGHDGRFTSLKGLLDDLRARPGFAAAFDDVEPQTASSSSASNFTARMIAEKAFRESEANKAKASASRPVLDPRDPSYNLTRASEWAGRDPDRILEVQRARAGYVR